MNAQTMIYKTRGMGISWLLARQQRYASAQYLGNQRAQPLPPFSRRRLTQAITERTTQTVGNRLQQLQPFGGKNHTAKSAYSGWILVEIAQVSSISQPLYRGVEKLGLIAGNLCTGKPINPIGSRHELARSKPGTHRKLSV